VIVVLGRPGLDADGAVAGTAALIALAASAASGRVEIVGSVGDDADGDTAITELGKAGVRHAAVLRDPAGVTSREGSDVVKPPRLDAADIELGLRYLADCQVLVIAESIPAEAFRVAADAAAYHSAALVVLTAAGETPPIELPENATLLEVPEEDGGAFAALVGRYAAHLDSGRAPADAWRDALGDGGWEKSTE
jgi:hypothetical protein